MRLLTCLSLLAVFGCGGADIVMSNTVAGDAEDALTTRLTCEKLTVLKGSIGAGQSAAALAKAELSGTTDSYSRYVEFSANAQATCTFRVPANLVVSKLQLRVNYMGPRRAEMPVSFEARDATSNAYVAVLDNGFAADWVWSKATSDFPGAAAKFIAADGTVTVRYTAASGDVSDIDQLVVLIPSATAPTSNDAGSPPAVVDAGSPPVVVDAGSPKPVDAGTTVVDAGTPKPVDAGTPVPVVDAGTPVAGTWWKPTAEKPIHWHWQLSDDFVYPRDVKPNVTVYDIDGEHATAATVAALHALGPDVKVICYFDVGVYENYRSDAAKFPASVIGNKDIGWAGSFWLDIRQLNIILPIMKDRMINWCKNKGFDAIEPDETEVWSNNSGFPITKEQNNTFNRAIADMAHSLGMSVGLKGNNTEAPELASSFDWALSEQCYEYSECGNFKSSFVAQNKAVFIVEYNVNPTCADANSSHMNASRRDLDLVGPTSSSYLYQPCIADTKNTW